MIYVVDNLDYETTKSYQLTVRATDSVTGEFANVFVNILIEDVNDNSPNFTQASYNAYVMETAEVGKSIATVSATDRDSGKKSPFVCTYFRFPSFA